ncbi:unnamed protein product, partial [marine sediment metagenome]
EYLRGLLLIKAGAAEAIDLPPEALSEMKGLAETAPIAQLSKAARLFRQVELEFDGFSPLPLELAMVECALPEGRPALPATPATPATPIKAKKTEVEPVTTPAPTEEKPATPIKAKKTEEEPVSTPAPIEEKPATPDKFEKFEKTDIDDVPCQLLSTHVPGDSQHRLNLVELDIGTVVSNQLLQQVFGVSHRAGGAPGDEL